MPPGAFAAPRQSTDDRHRLARKGELPPHDQHESETEQHEEQRRETVLDTDHLVILGEDVLPPERFFVVTRVVFSRGFVLLENTHRRHLVPKELIRILRS